MNMQRNVFIVITALVACVHEEPPGEPPPISSGNPSGGTDPSTGDEGGESSTGEGPTCDPEYAELAARAVVGCIYRNEESTNYFFIEDEVFDYEGSPGQSYKCLDYAEASVDDSIDEDVVSICAPYISEYMETHFTNPQGDVAVFLQEQAVLMQADCMNDHIDYLNDMPMTWDPAPGVAGPVYYRASCGCEIEFHPDGWTDFAETDNPHPEGGVADCSFINGPSEADLPQMAWSGECEDEPEDDECPLALCSGWAPGKWTSTSTCAGGGNCATIDTDLWEGIFLDAMDGEGHDLIECDTGRFVQHDSAEGGPAEWWSWEGLVAGDFFYEVGLRNGDRAKRIKIGQTWYPITTAAERIVAFEAFNSNTTFVLEVLRGGVTRSTTFTIQQCNGVSGC